MKTHSYDVQKEMGARGEGRGEAGKGAGKGENSHPPDPGGSPWHGTAQGRAAAACGPGHFGLLLRTCICIRTSYVYRRVIRIDRSLSSAPVEPQQAEEPSLCACSPHGSS